MLRGKGRTLEDHAGSAGPADAARPAGGRVILRDSIDSDVDDRLRHPIDPEEEDGYGSSGRREWDSERHHTREHRLAIRAIPALGAYERAVKYDRHCIGHAGLGVDADQDGATYTVGLFVAGLRGQGLGREITRLVLSCALGELGVHRVELEVLAFSGRAINCYLACGFRQEPAGRGPPGSRPVPGRLEKT